jgi:hypothetical protein
VSSGGCLMESVIEALKNTPIPTILVVAGIVFLLLSIAGQLAGRITVPPERQRQATIIGCLLIMIGVALHVVPPRLAPPQFPGVPIPTAPQPAPTVEQPQQPSGGLQTSQPSAESSVQASTEEKEPNEDITTATVIAEGTTVRGSIRTDEDQDFFRFNPSSYKTRVVIRTRSAASFILMVIVYDHVENLIGMYSATAIQPATFSFESTPASNYYLMVKTPGIGAPGNYELVVRKE